MIDAKYTSTVDDARVPRISSLIATAFGGPVKDCEEWVRNQGLGDIRCVDRSSDGRTDACYRRIEMGQFFGGRSIPMVGIAGVAVAPEARGQGLARWMMHRAIEEMYEKGEPLSVLYASTQPLYRQVGYEQAGHRVSYSLPIAEIDVRDRGAGAGGTWEAITCDTCERLKAPYRAFASRFDGPLDRAPYIWKRIFDWRERKANGYAHTNSNGEIDAYVVVNQKRKDQGGGGRMTIEVTDMAFTTPAAGKCLLGMLHDYASMADEVTFFAGPHHPIFSLLSQHRAVGTFKEYWMLRIVRAADALRLRGYNPALTTQVHLHLTDATLPGNGGPLTLSIEAGRAEVKPGGRGDVKLTERALASLYTGFASTASLKFAGMIEGPDAALATADLAFAGGGGGGGAPWMSDFF